MQKRISAKCLFVALKSQQLAGYQSTQSVCSNGNQVHGERLATRSITHDWAVKLQKEMQIFERSAFKGSCPNSISSFQLLENVAPALRSWWADVNILVWCSHLLPESRLSASLVCEACQLLSQVFLQGIFMLLCRRSCADLSFTNVKKEQQFQTQKLPLSSLGAFQPPSVAWFVEWLRLLPSW